jgi:hypothetical protein
MCSILEKRSACRAAHLLFPVLGTTYDSLESGPLTVILVIFRACHTWSRGPRPRGIDQMVRIRIYDGSHHLKGFTDI